MEKNEEVRVNVRAPKRVIHCSDGTVEEFSEDEADAQPQPQKPPVDPKSLNWGPWMWHYAATGGSKALEYCDYVGEGLADFLGITTPKYQLELSEYMRNEAAKKKLNDESAGWTQNSDENGVSLITMQPSVNAAAPEPKPTVL